MSFLSTSSALKYTKARRNAREVSFFWNPTSRLHDGRGVVADEHHELVVESGGVAQVSWVEGGCVTDADVIGFGVESEGEDGGGASSEVRDRLANIVAVSSAVAIREVGDVGINKIKRYSKTNVLKKNKKKKRDHNKI